MSSEVDEELKLFVKETLLSTSIDWFDVVQESIDATATARLSTFLYCCVMGRRWMTVGWRLATRAPHRGLEAPPGSGPGGEFEATSQSIGKRGLRQETDRRRAVAAYSRAEGSPAAPVARVRGRAKKSSDAMLEPSFRPLDGVLWACFFWPPQRDFAPPASAPAGGSYDFREGRSRQHGNYSAKDGSHPGRSSVARRGCPRPAEQKSPPPENRTPLARSPTARASARSRTPRRAARLRRRRRTRLQRS